MCTVYLAHAANEIKQTFPKNITYCCHCPNIELHCTFSEEPLIAFWTVNGVNQRVTDRTTGHTVYASNGALVRNLHHMNDSRGKTYICNAVYINETINSDPFPMPKVEG